ARTKSQLEEVATRAHRLETDVLVIDADVSQAEDVATIADLTLQSYGSIDVLVNAAAIHGPVAHLWESDAENWIAAMHVNLVGTFLCCRAVIPHMIAKKKGKIINFSGGGATSPSPFLSAYGVSKAAVVRLTETLALELQGHHVEVNAIAPGMVDTQIHDDVLAAPGITPELVEPIRRLRENGKGGVPKEVPARLALFLACSRSDGLSGKLIAAPHDDWQAWDKQRIQELMSDAWLTMRRIDEFTLKTLLSKPLV
ncbi:MAG: SDR family oxidoreductase, partial [Acidobacteria bacterium]|nr:SDR family oxidoreductase [Acidobacteriota bacterium]